jgi:dienelactone hydrolase
MHVEDIEYHVEGRRMVGHLAWDDTADGKRPAVLLCHEGGGLDGNVKARAARLAGLGYVAFALDYFGDGKQMPTVEAAMTLLRPIAGDPELTRRLGRGGLDVLLAHEAADPDRVAAIGFCFGAAMSLELGRAGADLKAIVGFHPGMGTGRPEDSGNITGSVLLCIGSADPFASAEQRLAFETTMTEAGVADWTVEVYGGVGHSFTNPEAASRGVPSFAYDRRADERSWQSMLRLFAETIGPPPAARIPNS